MIVSRKNASHKFKSKYLKYVGMAKERVKRVTSYALSAFSGAGTEVTK